MYLLLNFIFRIIVWVRDGMRYLLICKFINFDMRMLKIFCFEWGFNFMNVGVIELGFGVFGR